MSQGPTGPTGISGIQGLVGPMGGTGVTGLTGAQGLQAVPFGQQSYTVYSNTIPINLSYINYNTIVTIKYFPDISNTNLQVTIPSPVGSPPADGTWIIITYLLTRNSSYDSPVGGISFGIQGTTSNYITTTDITGRFIAIYSAGSGLWSMAILSNRASARAAQGINELNLTPLAYSGATAPTTLVTAWNVATNLSSSATMTLRYYSNTTNSMASGTQLTTLTPSFSGTGGTYTYTPGSLAAGLYYYAGLFTPSATMPLYSNVSQMPGGAITSLVLGTRLSSSFNSGIGINTISTWGAGSYATATLSCQFSIGATGPVTVTYYRTNGSGTTLLSTSIFTATTGSTATDTASTYAVSNMKTGDYFYAVATSVGRPGVTGTSTVSVMTTISAGSPGYYSKGSSFAPYSYGPTYSVSSFNYQPCYNVQIRFYASTYAAGPPPNSDQTYLPTTISAAGGGVAGQNNILAPSSPSYGSYNYGNYYGFAWLFLDYAGSGIYTQSDYSSNYSQFLRAGGY